MLVFAAEGDEKEVRIKSKKQGWLGVGIQDVTPTFAREHELKIKEGAYINEIVDDSPADSAGLKEGDVVVEFNGKKIEAAEDLTNAVRDTAPGTKAGVKIIRSGENKTISVNIGRNKMRMPFGLEIPRSPRVIVRMFGGDIEGMELMELNKQLGEYFEAPGGKGVLVKEVEKEENAAKAGIKAGDVITKVGDETIKDNEDIRDAISELKEGDKVNIELLRKGKKMSVSMEISEGTENEDHFFLREHMPGNFNFHFDPQMDQLHKEFQLQMKEPPRKQKEVQKIESKLRAKEI
jgi:serine protease Do